MRLASYVETDHTKTKERLFTEKRLSIFDFKLGWELLFTEFFTGHAGVLRDATFSSHGDARFQKYDFANYPHIIREFLERFDDRNHQVQFLMVCCPNNGDGMNNQHAEDFLFELLKIKYPHCPDRRVLFEKWKTNDPGERPGVNIMISNTHIIQKTTGKVHLSSPFNVYGDLALSHSIVRGAQDNPLPHLEVYVGQKEIEEFSSLFDDIWNASVDFRARSLDALQDNEKADFGSGNIFPRWSSYGG